MSEKRKRYILPEEEIPHYWYNIQADMVNKPKIGRASCRERV